MPAVTYSAQPLGPDQSWTRDAGQQDQMQLDPIVCPGVGWPTLEEARSAGLNHDCLLHPCIERIYFSTTFQ